MFLGCWNIRGLNDLLKHIEFHCLVQKHIVTPFGLGETRVREVNKDSVFSGGRIWVCWDPNLLMVDLLGSSDQIIHVCVTMLVSNISSNASFVYGENNMTKYKAFWDDIVSCSIYLRDYSVDSFG